MNIKQFSLAMLRSIAAVVLIASLAFGSEAFAQTSQEQDAPPPVSGIEIDVRVGARRVLVPLAVPDTQQPAGESQGVSTRVQEILRRNLDLAGYFQILPVDSFFFDPSKEGLSPADINFQNWFNVGAQGLIKSAVRVQGDKIQLDLRLYAVDKGRPITLKWTAQPVARGEVDAQVNDFINAVIEHYTGQRGIFGTRIVYAQRDPNGLKQIFSMDMDGTNRVQITRNRAINLLPTAGSGAVYYTSYQDNNPDLWVYRGGENKKLSSRRGQNSGAAYCNGKLALTLSMGGENADVYLIDPNDGKILRRLTDHWAIDTSPTWSADCSQIAFVSGRSGGPQIYVMNADGSDQRRLTHQGSYNSNPSWAPRGDLIAFSARDQFNRFDIFTVDLQGNIERLSQDQGNNEEPTFSPDGRYLIFTSDRGGRGKRLWLMTSDGEIQRLITTDGAGFTEPSWSR
ncbi:MAG: PD40 domain-containing protein [Bradymonadaceae bacterium]|nr:PD40 domain-containing protein [Lujinxingiaceae bacterium]